MELKDHLVQRLESQYERAGVPKHMTSKEIEETAPTDLSDRTWLKEIALQLALLNEKPTQNQQIVMQRRK